MSDLDDWYYDSDRDDEEPDADDDESEDDEDEPPRPPGFDDFLYADYDEIYEDALDMDTAGDMYVAEGYVVSVTVT